MIIAVRMAFFMIAGMLLVSCHKKTVSQNEAGLDYRDASLDVDKRVQDLLSRMTLEEKVAQMCQFVGLEHMRQAEKNLTKDELAQSDAQGFYPGLHSSEVEKMVKEGEIGSFLHVLDIEEANYLQKLAAQSRLGIPLLIGIDAIHGTALVNGATVYPTPIGLASTWDTTLVKELSVETAREVRAAGSTWTFTPNVDVARDARWGRVGETFGEDPFLVSEMGVAMIKGLQNSNNPEKMNVLACAKHLIAGSQSVNGLNGAPTDLSERTIREVFLPPYKAAVEAGVFSVMTAHNELNGIPCHSDKWMMEEVMRKELGFEGFVVSDWMDIERLHTRHLVAENQKEACYQTITAGMDMHMHGPGFLENVVELVKEGRIPEGRIDESAKRILTAKFKLGLFENHLVDPEVKEEVLFNSNHQNTSLEAARKSLVLLKNEKELLPLKGQGERIFVTGSNANNQTVLGDWSHQQPDENVTTVLEGIKEVAPGNCDIDFLDVGINPRNLTEQHIQTATLKAEKADYAVVVVGSNSFRWDWNEKTAGENSARSSLELFGLQTELVKAIFDTGTPTIVVLVNGRPLAIDWIAENVPSVVEAWEPGSKGGLAIGELLFGQINPSGKLPVSIPRSVGQQLSIYNHKPTHYFHKYVDDETGPLFHFGYGLSYTRFNYESIQLSQPSLRAGEKLKVKVVVSNVGDRDGDEVVQLYLKDKYASVTRPVRELKAFRRISLKKGESRQVTFSITTEMLEFLGPDMRPTVEKGEFLVMVGSSSRDKDLLTIPFILK